MISKGRLKRGSDCVTLRREVKHRDTEYSGTQHRKFTSKWFPFIQDTRMVCSSSR